MSDDNVFDHTIGVTPMEARVIANTLSGQLKVQIKNGRDWAYNFDNKTITYRQSDLWSLTETDVVANFLHEAGHAKYSIGPKQLTWGPPVEKKDEGKLTQIVNVIEDFRIEDTLRAYYPYAKDYLPLYSFKTAHELKVYSQAYFEGTGRQSRYIQYCSVIWSYLANQDIVLPDKEIMAAAEKTRLAAEKARLGKDTQEVADIIRKEIYVHIKKFLDEFNSQVLRSVTIVYASGPPPTPPWQDPYPLIRPLIIPTAAILSRFLTDMKFDKFSGTFRTGPKINVRRLYKSRLGETRLFMRRKAAKTKDYRFALVVDESGSMQGLKIKHAVEAAMLFAYTLERLSIPYSLHGFNRRIYHYKDINLPLIKRYHETIFKKMHDDVNTPAAEYNNDGLAIHEVSLKMLAEKNYKRRVMFVISDGAPAESSEGIAYRPLGNIVQRYEKQGIDIIGFGIGGGTEAVKDYYQTHVAVDKVEDLPKAIGRELKRKLAPKGGI